MVASGKADGAPQKQTLYFLHQNLEPGFVHSVRISVDGMGGELLGLSSQVWMAVVAVLLAVLLAMLQRGS